MRRISTSTLGVLVLLAGSMLAVVPGVARAASTVLFSDGFDNENGGVQQLNRTAFASWSVTAGCVDLMGNGGFYDFGPARGMVVELDGSCLGTTPTSRFRTKTSFTLTPENVYELSFDIAGNGNSHPPDTVNVSLDGAYTEPFSIETGWPITFSTVTRTISPSATVTAPIVFEVPNTSDFQGHFIDNVRLTSAPADTTPPVVTGHPDRASNGNGWYDAPVTIHWGVNDPAPSSGVPTQPSDTIATTEGTHTYTSGPSCDGANNCASGALQLSIDLSDPTVTCDTPPVFLQNSANGSVSAAVADNVSGPAATSVSAAVSVTSVGSFSVGIRGSDMAGRSTTAFCGYSVGYAFGGFASPVDGGKLNIAKAGQTVPVKWRIVDANGVGISDPASFVAIETRGTSDACSGAPDAIETYSGGSGLQYIGDGNWQFNWQIPRSYAGACRTLILVLAPGLDYAKANFQFK